MSAHSHSRVTTRSPFLCLLLTLAACGNGGRNNSGVVPPSLLAVAELRATTVALSWRDDSLTEAGFRVERSKDGAQFVVAGQVTANVTRFVDTGLTPLTPYRFRVHALVPGGGEFVSDPIDVTTVAASVSGVSPATTFDVGEQYVQVFGDGFSAGVDRVSFDKASARELEIVDDRTLAMRTPLTLSSKPSITVDTPSGSSTITDAFEVYDWPPTYSPMDRLRYGLRVKPESFNSAVDGGTAHYVWVEDGSTRTLFAARSVNGRMSQHQALSPTHNKPWHPHVAVDGRTVAVVWLSFGAVMLSVSENGGESFRDPIQVPATFGTSFFPRVAVSGQDIHVVWSDQRVGRGELYHVVSHDRGRSFPRAAFRINDFLGAFDVRVRAAGETVLVMWWSPVGFGGVRMQRSTDGGDTWPDLDQALPFTTGSVRPEPAQIVVDRDRVFLLASEGLNKRLAFMRSTDLGLTWDQKRLLDSSTMASTGAHLAVSPGGKEVGVTWFEHHSHGEVRFNRSLDGGITWLQSAARVAVLAKGAKARPVVVLDGPVTAIAYLVQETRTSLLMARSGDWGLSWRSGQSFGPAVGTRAWFSAHGADLNVTWLNGTGSTWDINWRRTLPK